MNPLGNLTVGQWHGTNILQDPYTNTPDESRGEATVHSILRGKFVRIDYTWMYQSKPQEGSILLGYQAKPNRVTAHWIDTWHMSDAVLACQGDANETLSVLGNWNPGSGPDWGWRINIQAGTEKLSIIMFNITPEGEESLAVEANYARV